MKFISYERQSKYYNEINEQFKGLTEDQVFVFECFMLDRAYEDDCQLWRMRKNKVSVYCDHHYIYPFFLRFSLGITYKQIGKKLNLSTERARQKSLNGKRYCERCCQRKQKIFKIPISRIKRLWVHVNEIS